MSGVNLPYKKANLDIYCHHMLQNQCLESQWCITTPLHSNKMKRDPAFLQYLQTHIIFITVTKVVAATKEVYGWWLYSHFLLSSCEETAEEIQARNNEVTVDLNPQTVRVTHNGTELRTKALVVSGPCKEKMASKDRFYTLEQGNITQLDKHCSDRHLNVDNIIKTDPDDYGKSLRTCLLYETAKDGTELFTSIKTSTRHNYLFVMTKTHKEEAEQFLDNLSEALRSNIYFKSVDSVDPDNNIKMKLKFTPSKYTGRAAAAYNAVLTQVSPPA
eukprot:12920750-Ditylum_brightwellii.AAC.1